jgi:hypothetical protein
VAVDEPGEQDLAGDVDLFASFVALADAGHVLAADRDVGLEELPREDRQDRAAAQHQVCRLVATGDGEPSKEVARHGAKGTGRHRSGAWCSLQACDLVVWFTRTASSSREVPLPRSSFGRLGERSNLPCPKPRPAAGTRRSRT